MPRHKHILITALGDKRDYTSTARGGGEFRTPPRDRRAHAAKLKAEVDQAVEKAKVLADETGYVIAGICLEVLGEEGFELKVESLEDSRLGMKVRSVYQLEGKAHATVFIPHGKLELFIGKLDRYATENDKRGGRPKGEDLVAGISNIRFALLQSFWTDEPELYPVSEDQNIWWEVWLAVGADEKPDQVFTEFVTAVADSPLRLSSHAIEFPERLIFLVFGSPKIWTRYIVPLHERLAELRRAKEIPTDFLDLSSSDQRDFVNSLASRIIPPPANAPSVCLLDYGVHAAHPLLRSVISENDVHSIESSWGSVDNSEAHGTEMAGLISFGDALPIHLANEERVSIEHRLESVRILRTDQPHPEETWGYVTQAGVSLAEVEAPDRQRVACLPVTADDRGRDKGSPSSWSAAIDEHSAGQLDDKKRLYVVSAGNIRGLSSLEDYEYPQSNIENHRIEDPGQSWNALTVGAFTNNVAIRSSSFDGCQPLAPRGGLCPTSRTSCSWDDKAWPLKPDIVMEGGNYARSLSGQVDGCDDLALLTTTMHSTGRLLTWAGDTSAATALTARSAAMLMAEYPNLWPETVRGLLVHSAEWTREMLRQAGGKSQNEIQRRLRCFGYGVPNLERARYTVENCVSLIHQGEIQPFKLEESKTKTNHFVTHNLPWPVEALRLLHDETVTVRITLSYFIEPSPGGRGWGKKFRYASHGLRFALRGPTEKSEAFRRRISTQEWEEEEQRPATGDPIDWTIGARLRTKGSIHCDWWSTSAANVAECGEIAIYPVTGWWRERKHLGCVEKKTRYALIVTISTDAAGVDLYTPVAQEVGLVTEVST